MRVLCVVQVWVEVWAGYCVVTMDCGLKSLRCRSVKWHGCVVLFISFVGNVFDM